jgi:hypothetical protein
MPLDEFEQYMSGQVVPVSTWESALMMCEVSLGLCAIIMHLMLLLKHLNNERQNTDELELDTIHVSISW